MVSLADDRGQALVMTVALVAIAALAVIGLRVVISGRVASAHLERTTAGASFAAITAVADVYVEWRGASDDDRLGARSLPDVMADPRTLARARAAADRIATANGLGTVSRLWLTCANGQVDVYVALAGQEARSGFPANECSRR